MNDTSLPRTRRVRQAALALVAGLGLLAGRLAGPETAAGEFHLTPAVPTLDRWVYPFNFQPGVRPVAPTYGSFDPRFDTRDAQVLVGWDTASLLATNAGPARYLIRRLRVTLTSQAPLAPIQPFVYDPTQDPYLSYLTNGEAGYVPDPDPGRPIEIYGVAFRGGFTTETFLENSPFGPLNPVASGNISIGTRNAYAAMFDAQGALIDIANHVAQRNPGWTNPPFEVRPWAVGTTTNAAPGEEMPDGGHLSFDLDLSDPLIAGYLQQALDQGRLRLMVSSLSPAGQSTPGGTGVGGNGAYPWWATKENILYDPPALEIEGTLIDGTDTDADGLADDWERFWFHHLEARADGDPDGDGATNQSEAAAGTDPTLATSVFRLRSWEFLPDGRLVATFPIAPSREYTVEASSDWALWTPVPGSVTYPESGLARWVADPSVLTVQPPSPRFYRVRVR